MGDAQVHNRCLLASWLVIHCLQVLHLLTVCWTWGTQKRGRTQINSNIGFPSVDDVVAYFISFLSVMACEILSPSPTEAVQMKCTIWCSLASWLKNLSGWQRWSKAFQSVASGNPVASKPSSWWRSDLFYAPACQCDGLWVSTAFKPSTCWRCVRQWPQWKKEIPRFEKYRFFLSGWQ